MVCNVESASLIKKMSQGDIHLALTSYGYAPEGLIVAPIHTESYRCVTANPLLVSNTPLTIEELVKHNFVITNPVNANTTGSADAWIEQQGLRRNVTVSAPTFHMTIEFLKSSNLVGFLLSRLLP